MIKEIIELANQVIFEFNKSEIKYPSLIGLARFLTLRKNLEQTPITEGFLAKHGFEFNGLWWQRDHIEIFIDKEKCHWNIGGYDGCQTIASLDSVAMLYDICELCGVKLED